MEHTLIVARLRPGVSEQDVAEVFARSDRGELPGLVGVRARTLFSYHDVYLHLIETDGAGGDRIAAVRDHPLFRRISAELEPFVAPYDPETWRSPADATARPFYRWTAP